MSFRFIDVGGTVTDIADLNLKITKSTNTGELDPVLLKTQFAGTDGVNYDGQYIPDRMFTVEMFTLTDTEDSYHTARKSLGDLIRRHRQVEDTPFTLQWINAGTIPGTIQIDAYYVGGLRLVQPLGYKEKITLVFDAMDPYWYGTTEGTTNFNAPGTLIFNNIAEKTGKANWSTLGGGLGGIVESVTYDSGGTLYSGGRYVTHGTAVGDIRRLGQYDGTSWSEVGNGVGTGSEIIYEIKFEPGTNKLWSNGSYVPIDVAGGSIDANGIAYYDLDTTTWGTISSTGGTIGIPSATIQSFDWDAESNIIVGGDFTVGVFHNVVVHDVAGGTFTYLTEGKSGDIGDGTAVYGLDNHVYKVRRIDTDEVTSGTARTYLGGAFDGWEDIATSGSTANYTSPFIWRDYGHTFDRGFKNSAGVGGLIIHAIERDPSGNVWFGGNQDNEAEGTTGIKDLYRVAKFDGYRFENMDIGTTDDFVYDLKWSDYFKGMYAMGTFESAGGDTSIKKVAFHNGSTWLPEQLDFSGVNVTSVSTYSNKTAFGFNGVITTYISETTIVSTGSVPVFPIFEFKGPGLLTYVYNETTDQIVQFSGLTLFANETLTIDLTSDNKSISSDVRGDAVARFLVDGGDIDTFSLASGNNTIKVNQATTLTVARIKHTPKYGSIDDGY